MQQRRNISDHVKSAITAQIRQEVDAQIQDHIPVSLAQQVKDSKTQLEEIKLSLKNSLVIYMPRPRKFA
jgi:hypothetical protein